MPGTLTHLYLAGKFLASEQKLIARQHKPYFRFGTIFPDIGYFPGNEPLISNLAHYVGSAIFPQKVFAFSGSEEWQAFSLGWLLHVQADILGHPFVNKLAAEISGSDKEEITYEEDVLLHAKVETSLDRLILKQFSALISQQIKFPELSEANPLSKAIREIYGFDFSKNKIARSISKIQFQLKSLFKLQKWILEKSKMISILKFFSNFQSEKQRRSTLSIMEDVPISNEKFQNYLQELDLILAAWLKDQTPHWPEKQYNLDTGKIARQGEYKLADETFALVADKIDHENLYWQLISADFLQA